MTMGLIPPQGLALFERTPGSVDENGRRERITSGTESSAAIVVRYRYPISHSTENSEQRSGGRTDMKPQMSTDKSPRTRVRVNSGWRFAFRQDLDTLRDGVCIPPGLVWRDVSLPHTWTTYETTGAGHQRRVLYRLSRFDAGAFGRRTGRDRRHGVLARVDRGKRPDRGTIENV